MLNSNKSLKFICLIISLIGIHAIGYFSFKHFATGQPIAGGIPEIMLYIVPAYFVTTLLIEFFIREASARDLKRTVPRAALLLSFFVISALLYVAFYHYIILAYTLQHNPIGQYSDLIFLIIMIFGGMKLAQKLDNHS